MIATFAVLLAVALLLGGCLNRKLKPLNPCLVSGVTAEIAVTNIDKVDLLFMVDDSGSMSQEQAALRDQFPKLITVLTTGDPGMGKEKFPPAKDLHLGVVTSDMGLVGISDIEKCSGLGDDGVMRNTPSPLIQGCKTTYPRFLTYKAGVNTPQETATDFACIATVGTDGCGFEQQLESSLKALWPAEDNRVTFLGDVNGFGTMGHGGDTGDNAGFLRSNANEGLSLIAIIVVTDEEDCSSSTTRHFTPNTYLNPNDPADAQLLMQGLNVRCNFNPQNLYEPSRYINGFKALRPDNENLVIFAAIVGVPPETVSQQVLDRTDFDNEAQRNAFYQGIYKHQLMQPVVDDQGTPDPADDTMRPSCNTATGTAYPPTRIVQVAEGFGPNGIVQSICQDDFGPAIDAIIKVIAKQLGAVCLPRPLVRNAQGLVGCNVVWELPPAGGPVPTGTPTQCGEAGWPFLLPPEAGEATMSKRGGNRCRVAQLAVTGEGANKAFQPTDTDGMVYNDGWYYDDFSEDVKKECKTTPQQRVAFTPAAKPPTGVTVKLECLNETQSLAENRTDIATNRDQPSIGDPCQDVMINGQMLSGDAACAVTLSDGTTDNSMFCHNELNVCVLGCTTDADCPAAWVCDPRQESIDAAGGRQYCVNPTCGDLK